MNNFSSVFPLTESLLLWYRIVGFPCACLRSWVVCGHCTTSSCKELLVPTHRSCHHTRNTLADALLAHIPDLCQHPTQLHSILQTSLALLGTPSPRLHLVAPHLIPQNVLAISFHDYRYGWIEGHLRGQIATVYGEMLARLEQHLLHQFWQKTNYHVPAEPPRCREREILTLSYHGLTYKEIAQALRISTSTVNSHATKLRDNFGVHTTHAAVPIADQAGFFHYLRDV
jgi:DNA-binding CsgD family transcriptional regulator